MLLTPSFILLFAGPEEINQVPALLWRKLLFEGGHAAKAVADGREEVGVAALLEQPIIEAGGWRLELAADQAGFARGFAMTQCAIDGEEYFPLRQRYRARSDGILQFGRW